MRFFYKLKKVAKYLTWKNILKYDPIRPLINSKNKAIIFFTKRDLLGNGDGNIKTLWKLPQAQKILSQQQPEGFFKYPGGNINIRSRENYNQLETYRNLGILVEKYGYNKKHPAIKNTADYLFKFQTKKGDFRGIYSDQYTPNYSAAIMELLIKAGYEKDSRINKGFKWLLSIRQNDGGWAIPFRTTGKNLSAAFYEKGRHQTIEPKKDRPSSHLITGIVLRAFSAHGKYRKLKEARAAGELLKSQFFKRDTYPDRSAKDFWIKFTYPFWNTNILTSLDSLSLIGFPQDDPDIKKALSWFIKHQKKDGRWQSGYGSTMKHKDIDFWVTLAICRVFKRFY